MIMLHSIGFVLLSAAAIAVLYFLWRKTPKAPVLLEDRVAASLSHFGIVIALALGIAAVVLIDEELLSACRWVASFVPETNSPLDAVPVTILDLAGSFGIVAAIFAAALLIAIADDRARPCSLPVGR